MRPRCLFVALLPLITSCDAPQRDATEDDAGPVAESDAAAVFARQELTVPAAPGSAEPHLSITTDDRPVISWLEPYDGAVRLRYAVLDGARWSAARTVATGNDWFVNWADFPSVIPIDGDTWAAHWLRKSGASSYAYDVVGAISEDGGATWGEPFVPHDDGTATEHGFVSLFPWQGGVGMTWLDGREMLNDAPAPNAMTLRSAAVDSSGRIVETSVVDDRVCECCQTDVALASSGPLLAYRNRSENEVRDIHVARHVDGQWVPGGPVADDGWEIAGCPVNGPDIEARGDGAAIAWFTAAADRPAVRLAFSADAGVTFGEAIDIDGNAPIGRVGLGLLEDGSAIVSWLAGAVDGQSDIRAQRVAASGARSAALSVGTTSSGRLSGFPQVVVNGANALFAYTDATAAESQVRTVLLPLSAFDVR